MLKIDYLSLKWRILRRLKLADSYEFMRFRAKQDLEEISAICSSAVNRLDAIRDRIWEQHKKLGVAFSYVLGMCEGALQALEEFGSTRDTESFAKEIISKGRPEMNAINKLWEEHDEIAKVLLENGPLLKIYTKRYEALDFLTKNKHTFSEAIFNEVMGITDDARGKTQAERKHSADRLVGFLRKHGAELPEFMMEYVETFDREIREQSKALAK